MIADNDPDVVALRARIASLKAGAAARCAALQAHAAMHPGDAAARLLSGTAELMVAAARLYHGAGADETARRIAECREATSAALSDIAADRRQIEAEFGGNPRLAAMLCKESAGLAIAEMTRSVVSLVLWSEGLEEQAWRTASGQLAELAACTLPAGR
jgi:hypothetical protein